GRHVRRSPAGPGALRATTARRAWTSPRCRPSTSRASGPAAQLLGVAVLEEGLLVGWQPTFDLASALEFGIEFGAQQHPQVREPQPDEKDDHPGNRSVGP